MDTKRWQRMKEIFQGALDLGPDARRAFLDEACRDDAHLRKDIESLLSSHEKANGFLEELSETEWPALEQELPFTRIGPYLLQRIISSGGMGTVYEAIQENPRRTVAIKVMGEGIASKSALRRFEYESQILARLTHPNIAQVIEAGTHHGNGRDRAEGTPYFVMEYIEGAQSLTEYARQEELAVSERLQLFLPVCEAVQHGHQKGVIHRDLKPSNLLVDSSGKVKVIDFGIARATDSDMALTTVQTDVGQLMGTLQYMSPEQCRADPNDLDVRSDVYALGVVLYELLCETLPYDVRRTAVFEAARIIRESQPRRPSTANRALRGDVETIVLKALEKDRVRRYQTVMELGGDIRRHLHGEVILAKPAGPVTKAWKRAKRTPVLSATAGMALLSVAVFIGYILLVSYPQLKRERDIAETETKKAIAAEIEAVEARAVAEKESDNTRKINDFLEAMLVSADPFREGREVKVREMLDKAVEMIEKKFPDRPGIEASLRNTLGTTYYNLGMYDAAEVQLSKAFELRRRIYGQYEADTLITMNCLGLVYRGQGRYSEAESLFHEALETGRKKFGEEHSITLRSEHNLAWVRFDQGRYSEAEAIFRKVVEASRGALGEEEEFTLSSMNSLANMLMIRGAYPEAESILREAIETQSRILGDEHLETLLSMNSLANVLMHQGAYDEAESIYREILVIYRRVLGDEHRHTLGVMNNVANALMNQGSFSEAESIHREVLAIRSRVFGEEHLETLRSMNYLALVLHKQGRLSEAEDLFRELLEIRRRTLGEEHPDTLMSMCNLGLLLQDRHRLAEAESIHREVLKTRRRFLGEEHPETLGSRNNLALVLYRQGRFAEAESIHREVLKIRRCVQGNEHPDTLKSMSNLAVMLEKQGELDEAGSIHQEVLEIRRRVLGEEHPETLGSMNNLAIILKNQGRLAEAESMHREVLETRERVLGREHPKTLSSMYNLANVLKRQDKLAEAELLLRKVLEIRVPVLGAEHPKTLNTMHGLANVMKNQGKLAEAESFFKQLFDVIDRISQKDPYFIALLRSDYGDCLTGLGRYAEAEDSLLEAYRALKTMRGKGHKNTESVKDRLVELYKAWDKSDQAAEWRAKLEDGD